MLRKIIIILIFIYISNASQIFSQFVDNNDQTVSDKSTGLMWSKDYKITTHPDEDMSFTQIVDWVNKLELANYNDWRVPNINELRTISLTRNYRYDILPYDKYNEWDGDLSFTTKFHTSDVIPPHFVKEYYPFSDGITIENKYDFRDNTDYDSYIVRPVRGDSLAAPTSPPGNLSSFKPNAEVDKIIKSDGFAYFKYYSYEYGRDIYWLLPTDMEKYPYLTFCPKTALIFFRIPDAEIANLSIENNLKNNDVIYSHKSGTISEYRINLWDIKDFYDYYKSFLTYDKFEMAQKEAEVKNTLKSAKSPYAMEYRNFLSSTFILTPFTLERELTQDNYNVDNKSLSLLFSDSAVIKPTSYGTWFYGAYTKGSNFRSIQHNPFLGSVNLAYPLDKAAQLFKTNNKIFYKCYHYIKPVDNIFNVETTAIQGFEVEAILFEFRNDKYDQFMSILLYDHKPSGWTIKFIID